MLIIKYPADLDNVKANKKADNGLGDERNHPVGGKKADRARDAGNKRATKANREDQRQQEVRNNQRFSGLYLLIN